MELISLEDEISLEEIEQLEKRFVKHSELQGRIYKSNKKIRYVDYLMWLELDCYDRKNTFFTSNSRDFNYRKLTQNLYKKIKTDDLISIIDRAQYFFEYEAPKKEFIKNDPYFLFLSDDNIYLDHYNVYEGWRLIFNELNEREELDKISELNINGLIGGWKHSDNFEPDEYLRCILIDMFLFSCKKERNINEYNDFKNGLLKSLYNLGDNDDYHEYSEKLSNIVNYFLSINNTIFNIKSKEDSKLLKQYGILNNNIISDSPLMNFVKLINEKTLANVKQFLEKNEDKDLRDLIAYEDDKELKEVIKPVFSFSINYLASAQKENKVDLLMVLKDFDKLLQQSIFNDYFDLLKIPDGSYYIINKKSLNDNGNVKDDCEKFLENLLKHPKLIREKNLENLNSIIEKNLQQVLIPDSSKKSKKIKF